MKKTFTQPFDHSNYTTAYLLVEIENNTFLQLLYRDELGLSYFSVLDIELDKSVEQNVQLAKYLYSNGISLNYYRELIHETKLAYSFIDNTPGYVTDEICLYIHGDRIKDSIEISEKETLLVSLDEMLDNLKVSPHQPRAVALAIARLINERQIVNTNT